MGLLKSIGRGLKRIARNKVVMGAIRAGVGAATGGQSEVALRLGQRAQHIAKQIGAKMHAGQVMKKQQAAVNVAVEKMAKLPAPKVSNAGSERVEDWNVQDQAVATDRVKVPANVARSARQSSSPTKRGRKPKATRKKGKPMSAETKAKLRARPKKAKSGKRSGAVRKGMLDLKAMAKARRESADGMSTDWRTWIKRNPIYVK